MKYLKYAYENFEEFALALMLGIMFLLIFAQVISREIFGYSLSFTEELTRYLLMYSGLLSASYTLSKHTAMRITMVVSRFNIKIRHTIICVQYVIVLLFSIFLSFVSIEQFFMSTGVSQIIGLPHKSVYFVAIIAFLLSVVHSVHYLVLSIKYFGKKSPADFIDMERR